MNEADENGAPRLIDENEVKELNEKFYFNIMLAKGLVQLLPATDRKIIRVWFDKLCEMEKNVEELKTRNDYIWFILLMLHNNKILGYFRDLPPQDLAPLRSIFTQNDIDEILLENDENMSWLEMIHEDHADDEVKRSKIPPSCFLNNQPSPNEGVICYMSVFSDHF